MEKMEDAAKRAKDAAKKLFGGPKKFGGSGHKLGGGESSGPANHPAARKPSEPVASPPLKTAARAPAPAPAQAPGRKLGFQDSAPAAALNPSAPQEAIPPVPETAPQEAAVEVTDSMSEAAAMIVSSGPAGLKAAKTVCSVISNVLKAPKEAKYRQLNCDNPRVSATLEVPGVLDLFRELGFQHLQEASTSSSPPDPGMLNLPRRFPGPKEPLYHGALSVLQPSLAEAASTTPAATSSEPPDVPPAAPPQATPATEAAAPVDTPMADVDDVTPPGDVAAVGASQAASAPAMDWGDGGKKDSEMSTSSQGAAPAVVQSSGLGMSSDAWKAENKNNPKKAVMIGNVAMPTARPQAEKAAVHSGPSGGVGGSQGVAATAAPERQEKEDDGEFTGRNTKVLLPTAPDSEIPESFFERTGKDMKAEWQRVKQQREQDQTLMTKAHRDKLRMAGRKVHKYATVRVRFPEGIVLQGCFLPTALAFEVHAWVTDHLRALEPFELSSPVLPSKDRKLGHGGSVKEAGLMPTCALNFRWTPGGEPVHGPCLSDAALKTAQMDV